jgi:hypothetical protein
MSPDDVAELKLELVQLREVVRVVEGLQREANGRLSNIEGRVLEMELWRARLQGAAATSRVVWLLAGGALTGIILEVFRATA